MRGLKIVMLALSLLLLAGLNGCVKTVLHPITQQDIILLNEGDTITAPKSGAFVSDLYITEVMEARIE